MNIGKELKQNALVLYIEGRIDTTNYKDVETEITNNLETNISKLILNCEALSYISSSGLRIFLTLQKKMMTQKTNLILSNMQPMIKEIFDISGFANIFQIIEKEDEAFI